jgi:nucleoside-diphosphate-sugar epimerase
MENVLITGGTGFIGKCLVQQLLNKKKRVRVLTRNIPAPLTSSSIEYIKGDLTQSDTLINICENVDTVFHLGGYAHAWEETNPIFAEQHRVVNYQGTKNILAETMRAHVKRFIYFSSVKAVADSQHDIDETWIALPDTPYGIAKRNAEEWIISAKNTDMHICILRPALVYGPESKGNLSAILRAIDKGVFPPIPNIKNCRSLISVEDICTAAILAAEHEKSNGQIYFVTDGILYSTRQLYELICESLQKPIPRWHVPLWVFKLLALMGDIAKKWLKRRLPFDSDAMKKLFGSAQYNSKKIEHELGFKPQYDFKKMLPKIIEKYKIHL